MFVSLSTLIGLALVFCLHLWLKDSDTLAGRQYAQRERERKASLALHREQRKVARRALKVRFYAMARCYFRQSVWQYALFMYRAGQCRTDIALNRYVTLAEQYWSTKTPTVQRVAPVLPAATAPAPQAH